MSALLSIEILDLLAPALIAGLLVAATHVPLGQEVLKRGIIFIDLAIAQIAALGVVVCHTLLHLDHGMLPVVMAMVFALCGGGVFAWLEKVAPKYQEAFIGSAFVLSAALIILLYADNPHGGEEIQGLLAGQILWVRWPQIMFTAAVYALILFMWFGKSSLRERFFYLLFPVAITLSIQLVGIYMVFASLIMPALGALLYKRMLLAGYVIAGVALSAGLFVSVAADLPTGPVLVCAYAVSAAFVGCYMLFKNRALQ